MTPFVIVAPGQQLSVGVNAGGDGHRGEVPPQALGHGDVEQIYRVNVAGTRNLLEALAGGSLDIGFSATLSVLQAVQQGLDLVIVAPGIGSPLEVRKTPW